MPWSLEITRSARRDLADLPAADREAVRQALDRLVSDPSGADLRKLQGTRDEWALRVGRWRVLMQFDNAAGVMLVRRVLPRRDAYRG